MGYYYFSPIITAPSVIITYGIHPFDICVKNPELWHNIKLLFIFTYIFSSIIISNLLYENIFKFIFSYFFKLIHKIYYFNNFIKNLKNKNSILNDFSNKFNLDNSLELYVGDTVYSNEPIYLNEKSHRFLRDLIIL